MAMARTTADKNRRARGEGSRVAKVRTAPNTSTMEAAASVPADKPLTEKQRTYALARARGESVANAMAEAGYNEQQSWGYRLDKMPNVRALIQQEQALYAESAQIDRKKVVDMHLEAYAMAKMMAEPSTMVAAAREIGKVCGLYEPKKVELSLDGAVTHEIRQLEQMSDAELVKLVQRSIAAPQ